MFRRKKFRSWKFSTLNMIFFCPWKFFLSENETWSCLFFVDNGWFFSQARRQQ
jgi:hypothetical protein